MLSKQSSTTSIPRTHWATRASAELKKLSLFLEVKNLKETYDDFNPSHYQNVPSSSVRGSRDDGGGYPQDNFNNDPNDPDHPDESDDDDDDFDDGDDPFQSMEKSKIEVFVRCEFDDRKSSYFVVRSSWAVKSLSYIIANKWGISPSLQRFVNAKDEPIYTNLSFDQNLVKSGHMLKMLLSIDGAGKRSKGSVGDVGNSSNNLVSGMSKDDALKKLEDTIGLSLMRCNINPNTSPIITEACRKIWDVVHQIKEGQFSMEKSLLELNIKQLSKLRDVKAHSTRVPERCRFVSDILFSNDVEYMKELNTQAEMVKSSMVLSVQKCIIHEFADEAGNIAWDNLTKLIQEVEHQKIEEKAKRATQQGLGM